MSKVQGECFHQDIKDIKEIERRYQGKRNLLLVLQQDEPNISYKRYSNFRSFEQKRKRFYKLP